MMQPKKPAQQKQQQKPQAPHQKQQAPQQAPPMQQAQPKPRVQETEDWDARLLKEIKYFTVVLNDGETIQAKLLEINRYHLQLETDNRILLVPKHSVKYIILRELKTE